LVIWFDTESNKYVGLAVTLGGFIVKEIADIEHGILILMSSYLLFEITVPPKFYPFVIILDVYNLGLATDECPQVTKKYIMKLLSHTPSQNESP